MHLFTTHHCGCRFLIVHLQINGSTANSAASLAKVPAYWPRAKLQNIALELRVGIELHVRVCLAQGCSTSKQLQAMYPTDCSSMGCIIMGHRHPGPLVAHMPFPHPQPTALPT